MTTDDVIDAMSKEMKEKISTDNRCFIEESLKELQEKYDWSQVNIERALGIEIGLLSTESSPETVALMKVLRAFPWVLEVAERRYDKVYADKAVIHAAIDEATKNQLHALVDALLLE
jgi:hypothetical protein